MSWLSSLLGPEHVDTKRAAEQLEDTRLLNENPGLRRIFFRCVQAMPLYDLKERLKKPAAEFMPSTSETNLLPLYHDFTQGYKIGQDKEEGPQASYPIRESSSNIKLGSDSSSHCLESRDGRIRSKSGCANAEQHPLPSHFKSE